MENTDRRLSFPQRNWFLLCILVAIISPLIVHFVQAGAKKESMQQTMDIHETKTTPGDTSTKVASPPTSDTSKKPAGAPPDSLKH
jgi:hypothetical protein